jgi:hypothetical protein
MMAETHGIPTSRSVLFGRRREIFVIDAPGAPILAFEADHLAHAEDLVRSGWLAPALQRFYAERLGTEAPSATLRAATNSEMAQFRDQAEEFSDAINHFFLADVTESRVKRD